jgi:hypothetical protein
LIPGAAPAQAPAVAPSAAATARTVPPAGSPALTPSPAAATRAAVQPLRSSDDLLRLARAYSMPDAAGGMTDEMAARFRLPGTATELLKQPRPRIGGLLPMENSIKNSIDGAMAGLRTANVAPEERARRLSQAVDSLNALKRGLTVKSGISDRTYQAMGMPPLYVQEEREAIRNSIARVDAALGQLQRQ